MAGKCSLTECKTTLSLEDVLGLNELVAVETENERRAYAEAERKAQS